MTHGTFILAVQKPGSSRNIPDVLARAKGILAVQKPGSSRNYLGGYTIVTEILAVQKPGSSRNGWLKRAVAWLS